MTVITAIEFDNFIASGESARQSNARHRRFGPTVDHSDLLNRRHPLTDQFGQFHFERIRNSETQSARSRIAHGIDYDFWRVTENSRTPTADVVDVFFPIDIPNFRARSALNAKGFAADIAERAHWRINAAGNALLGGGEEFGRTRGHGTQKTSNAQRSTPNIQFRTQSKIGNQ